MFFDNVSLYPSCFLSWRRTGSQATYNLCVSFRILSFGVYVVFILNNIFFRSIRDVIDLVSQIKSVPLYIAAR